MVSSPAGRGEHELWIQPFGWLWAKRARVGAAIGVLFTLSTRPSAAASPSAVTSPSPLLSPSSIPTPPPSPSPHPRRRHRSRHRPS